MVGTAWGIAAREKTLLGDRCAVRLGVVAHSS